MLPKNRPPTHPREVLLEELLVPTKMTQVDLAERMGVPVPRVNTLINGKRGITAGTALKLAKVFQTSPELSMNLQSACDLWHAAHDHAAG